MDSIVDKKLTTDLVADPTLHRLGLEVSPTGMDVVVTSRVRDNALIYRHIDFAPGDDPVKALEEAVYDNPLLTADFGKVDIVVDSRRFFVMDADEATDDEVARRIEMLYPSEGADTPRLEPLVNVIETDRTVLVTAIGRDLMRFLRRTFNNPAVTHRMAALARYYGLRNHLGNSGKVHVMLVPGSTDIIVYGHNGLMMANTFDTPSTQDAVYYTLATVRHLGYDNDADRLMVSGDRGLRDAFVAEMRRFVAFAMPEIFPSALTRLGDGVMDVPFEILVLALCE